MRRKKLSDVVRVTEKKQPTVLNGAFVFNTA